LEKKAVTAVEGCSKTPPECPGTNYTNFEQYYVAFYGRRLKCPSMVCSESNNFSTELDQGPINIAHTTIAHRIISYWQTRLESRLKMLRPDILSLGCAVAKCPESSGAVNVTVACFYDKG
uniref:SCP domain-containing protein n=1 Tax=Angiostrongylus cantonensis TaxID=6313 RepID=A0A0K0DJX6_ANGCA